MPALPEPPAALTLLLQALSARRLTLQTLPPAGPDRPEVRPILTPQHLLLPARAPELQRAAVAHAAAHLLHSVPSQPTATLKPLGLAVVSAVEDARVEQLLAGQLPGVRAWFDAPLRDALDPQGLSAAALLSRLDLALHDEDHADGNHWVNKARTLFDAARRAHGLEDAAAFRRLASVLAHDLGQMRVRFEPRAFCVPCAYRDDHSYLWNHGAARDDEAQPLEQPLATPGAPPRDSDTRPALEPVRIHHYPEWDARSGVLRRDWCTLHDHGTPPPTSDAPAQPPHRSLPLHRRQGLGRRQRRQPEGVQLDLDALVDDEVLRRLRLGPSGRVFQRPGVAAPVLSLLLLIDSSQSTATHTGTGPSLLQLEQEAAFLLAHAAADTGSRLAIHAFNSDTRARVHYRRLLDFGMRPEAMALARLQALRSEYSTRLGAALRHAGSVLATEARTQRVLLVLTDGSPSDVDVHDPHHLVEDARHAVLRLRAQGVAVHGLVVGEAAADDARRIFGPGHYRIARSALQIAHQLTAWHAQFAGR
ncbi:MAG: VWA domain-containing protein [Hylemonella sp.]|uniref:nitric oxide reductase activation protein NorD n=1 Tax=Hylemonella sp. TaxID=2066020 RepID=UPI0022C7454C|nr:VWA domain-containing protein [Hylemonella sp.]MCZ8253701.1 VWA domain-containing protein [Hylemonella sp.]